MRDLPKPIAQYGDIIHMSQIQPVWDLMLADGYQMGDAITPDIINRYFSEGLLEGKYYTRTGWQFHLTEAGQAFVENYRKR